ncbi:MAG: type II toxin-antitoxin system ParD family antitoxin [Planctomycetaceae bacterium]|nr:type II toxin-antitoxin system ParD family antitoxin [Planctomycetaceae bacterium]
MSTRNVILTDHQAAFIEQLVESGQYQNAGEVLDEGLRLVEERRVVKLARLREAVARGIESIEAGHYEKFSSPDVLGAYVDSITEEALREE